MPGTVVITTGGTIASTADGSGALRPSRSGAELLGGQDARTADLTSLDLMSKDSSQIALSDWDLIRAAIDDAIAGGADGIVVTHGTDTLEETALWVDLTYEGDIPVVLTGAMRSADAPDADGPANLRDAVIVASHAAARGSGALICMGGDVLAPLGTTKFGRSPSGFDGPVVGTVTADGYRPGAGKRRPALGRIMAASAPRVDIVTCYLGVDAVALDAVVAAGARGVVLAALGSGNAAPEIVDAVRRLCAAGVTVAVASRVPFGGVSFAYGPGRDLADAGAHPVPRLHPAQARLLVTAALALGLPVDEVLATWG